MFSTGVRTKMMDIIWNTSYTVLIPNYKEKKCRVDFFFGEQNRGEISYFLVSVRVAVGRKMSTRSIFSVSIYVARTHQVNCIISRHTTRDEYKVRGTGTVQHFPSKNKKYSYSLRNLVGKKVNTCNFNTISSAFCLHRCSSSLQED